MSILKQSQICCVIVTYNPDDIVFNLINIIKNKVDKIIVVDNNSQGQSREIISRIAENNEVGLVCNEVNGGIAKALNQGVALAKKMGYEWVLTFDQDTTPFVNIIEVISEVYASYPDKRRVGAIGVNFSNANSESYYRIANDKQYHERDYLITSGCLLSINAFSEIGGFREDLFIDYVDIEYSLRLRKHGKVSLITRKWGMSHRAGSPKTKKYFGLNLVSSNHNSFRRYYMARNHVILSREYLLNNPYFIAKASFFFILSLLQLALVENERIAKMAASFKGIIDGIVYSSKYRKLL